MAAAVLLSVAIGTMVGCRQEAEAPSPSNAVVDGETINAGDAGLDIDAIGHDHDHEGHGHDHDGHHADHEASLRGCLDRVVEMKSQFDTAFAADNGDSVHDLLHDVGEELEHLTTAVNASELPANKKKDALAAVESLMDNFGEVDAVFHGGTGKSYADVKASIQKSLDTLGAVAGE